MEEWGRRVGLGIGNDYWLIDEGIYWQHDVLLSSDFFYSTFSSAFRH